MKHAYAFLLVFACLIFAPSSSVAAPITLPPGLNSGDQYRLVFVTSATTDALSSDIADYNAFVTAAASAVPELAALGTTWAAIGSTTTVDARDNTGTNPLLSAGVPMFRLDGVKVADDNADLWDGSPDAPINVNELGNAHGPSTIVWTGTLTNGTAQMPFANQLGSSNALNGYPGDFPPGTEYNWIQDYSPAASDEPGSLYAISGVITAVPEPSSYVLAALGAITLAFFQCRKVRSECVAC